MFSEFYGCIVSRNLALVGVFISPVDFLLNLGCYFVGLIVDFFFELFM